MTTDLEHDIRDALHQRAEALTIDDLRYAREPRTDTGKSRRVSAWAAVAAAAVVAAIAVAVAAWPTGGRESVAPPAGQLGLPAVNTTWQLREITGPTGTFPVPADVRARLELLSDGRMVATDGVNALGGEYRPTADGFIVTSGGTTLALYGGHDPMRLAVIAGMRAVMSGADGRPVDVVSRLSGDDEVALQVGSYTLVFRNAGPAPSPIPPSPTPTRT
jgi:hypothetical protein